MKDIGTTRPVITIAVLTIVAKIFGLVTNGKGMLLYCTT